MTILLPPQGGISLYRHQQEGIYTLRQAITLDGLTRPVVAMATGAGKTILAGAFAYDWLEGNHPERPWPKGIGRTLFLAHRWELLQQARGAFARFFPVDELGYVVAEYNEPTARHVFASFQTLFSQARRDELKYGGPFALVVFDECHHVAAEKYLEVLLDLVGDDTVTIGITATPSRADGISLRVFFEELVYSVGMLDLIAADPPMLVDLRPISLTIPDLDLSSLVSNTRTDLGDTDFSPKELEKLVKPSIESGLRHRIAVEAIKEYAPNLQGLFFGTNVADCYKFAELANSSGIPTAVVSGKTPEQERSDALRNFEQGNLQYLANVDVFTEGTDLPMAQVAIIGRHTRSKERYIQMIGRVTRPLKEDREAYPGDPSRWRKREAFIFDLCDNAHSVHTLPALIGTTELVARGKSVKQLLDDGEISADEGKPKSVIHVPGSKAPLSVSANSIYTQRPWRSVGRDYQLTSRFGTYRARHVFGETYELVFAKPSSDPTAPLELETLTKPVRLEIACGKGEEDLERREYRWRRAHDPSLRSMPASPGSIERLQRTRLPTWRGMTVGQVDDLWREFRAAGGSPSAFWARRRAAQQQEVQP